MFFSIFVGVLLKISRKKELNIYQIISWNYLFALVSLLIFYNPQLNFNFDLPTAIIIVSLIIILPVVFVFQANAIKYSGIVKTDIAQRLSLFIPISFALFIAKEVFNLHKIIGLTIAFIAIIFTFYKKQQTEKKQNKSLFLLLTLIGFGVIDILFKKVATISNLKFTELLLIVFCGAFLVSLIISAWLSRNKKEILSTKNLYWGMFVGILNFGNIILH